MTTVTKSSESLANLFRISAGFFLISAIFYIFSSNLASQGIFYVWLVVVAVGFAFFAYLLHQANETYQSRDNTLKGAMGVIILMVIIDFILWLGLINFWLFVYEMGIFLFFGVDILRGIGFSLAFVGLKKIDKRMNNPTYLIYGWAPLVFEILYWSTESPTDEIILNVETWVVAVLLILVAVFQFVKSNQVAGLTPQPKPVAPGYSPYQPYQQQTSQSYQQQTQGPVYQTQAPVQESQTGFPMQGSKFCSECGAKIAADAKFCTNCGSNT